VLNGRSQVVGGMSQVRLDEAGMVEGYESRDIWMRKVITRCEVPDAV
jgi:hypothetical protein